MKKLIALLISSIAVGVCAEEFGGVEFPDGERSFADRVINYFPGPGVSNPYNDPTLSLGIPDGDDVSLGNEGSLIVEFTDNSLTTSGDSGFDLWIFEVGSALEPTQVYVSDDGDQWIDIGATTGSTYGIDLDAYIEQGIVPGKKYRFVKLVDLLPSQSGSPYPGADIDAIGAISSAAPAYYGQYVDTIIVPDMNSNSHQEIAILRYHPKSGQPNVLLLDSRTGETIRSIDFLTDRFKPISVDVLPDTDKNGYPNISVLGVSDTGDCNIHIKDAFTRKTIRKLSCPSN